MNAFAQAPGLSFSAAPRPVEPSPLRSDVAAFIGQTRRGPFGVARRVEGWRAFLAEYGGLRADSHTPYALRGYFENGGQLAYVVRVGQVALPDDDHPLAGYAHTQWDVRKLDGQNIARPAGFFFEAYRLVSATPGDWAGDLQVSIDYRREGLSGRAEVDLTIKAAGEATENLLGLPLRLPPGETVATLTGVAEELPDDALLLPRLVASRSRLLRLVPEGKQFDPDNARQQPRTLHWEFRLPYKKPVAVPNENARKLEYLEAVRRLGDEPEAALLALPGLFDDLPQADDRQEVIAELLEQAAQLHDRLVLLDLPADCDEQQPLAGQLFALEPTVRCAAPKLASKLAPEHVLDQTKWRTALLDGLTDEQLLRNGAVYHPWLDVPDPLGGVVKPLRRLPPSGHVAGVISRLDRERGAHHTPANAPIFEAVDVACRFKASEQGALNEAGLNLLRCFPGAGIQVWGGRTLARDRDKRFVAHRRLIHRLVRAIHRVADPLVFELNGPELWLGLVRAITTVLLEAWHAGALQGGRPEDAFQVRCDAALNPPVEQDLGRVLCEIDLAPAVPMEFIQLRVLLGGEGRLEVFES